MDKIRCSERRKQSSILCGISILAFLLAATAEADQKTEEILLVTAAATDIISTEWALANTDATELNPLLQSPAKRIAVKAGVTTGLILLARKMDRDGKHGAAKWIRWPAIGVWFGATGWNISVSILTN